MARFRDIKTLQKFTSAHASIHNHFNLDRHLNRRAISKTTAPPPWPRGANWRPKEPLLWDYWRPVRIGLTMPSWPIFW